MNPDSEWWAEVRPQRDGLRKERTVDEDLRPEVTRTLQAMRDHGEREVVSELLNEIALLRQLLRDVYPYIRQSDNPEARPIMKRLEKELDRK